LRFLDCGKLSLNMYEWVEFSKCNEIKQYYEFGKLYSMNRISLYRRSNGIIEEILQISFMVEYKRQYHTHGEVFFGFVA